MIRPNLVGCASIKRWFKCSDINLPQLFKVGTVFQQRQMITHDMANNRTNLGHFVISTPALANSLHHVACNGVDVCLPPNCHSVTRFCEIKHKEPLLVGENMDISVRVTKVESDAVHFDLKVLRENAESVSAEGGLVVKVIRTERE
jgi:predicted thioesterase